MSTEDSRPRSPLKRLLPSSLATSALAWATSAGLAAAPGLVAFPGAEPGDLGRPLPASALSPRLLENREALECYSLWAQLDDGSTLLASLLISNLGRARQPAVHISLYPAQGKPVEAFQELEPEVLGFSPGRVVAGRNMLVVEPDGRYHLRLAAPVAGSATGQGGELTVDVRLKPILHGFKRGDGKVWFGEGQKHFELLPLIPQASLRGHYTLDGKVVNVTGNAYLDHTAQNLWAHKIAQRWSNYRFFSPELFAAVTSFLAPPEFGSLQVTHALVARGGEALFATDQQDLRLEDLHADGVSGYRVPRRIHSTLAGETWKLELSFDTDPWLDRQDLLGDVNPVIKAMVRILIARPFAYRFRVPATAKLTRRGAAPTTITGLVVSELIFVND